MQVSNSGRFSGLNFYFDMLALSASALPDLRLPGLAALQARALLSAAILCVSSITCCAAAEAPRQLRMQERDKGAAKAAHEPYQYQSAEYRLAVEEEVTHAPIPMQRAIDKPFSKEVALAAEEAGVEPELVHALIEVESAYRPHAVSPKGAVGLMQLLPETAQRYGVSNLVSVPDNLKAGTRHLRTLLDTFGDRLDLVLAAYNAGEGAVRKYNNAIPPYRETRDYVPAVLKRYRKPEAPAAAPKLESFREYMPGTRLDPASLRQLQ